MMWFYVILFVENILQAIVNTLHLQPVVTLPQILGVDVDTLLQQGVGTARTFFTTFWPLLYMFYGSVFLMLYFGLKMVLTLLLGHRAPGR